VDMPYEVPRSPILANFVLCMPPKSRLERSQTPFRTVSEEEFSEVR
jgi:hypothetical protein